MCVQSRTVLLAAWISMNAKRRNKSPDTASPAQALQQQANAAAPAPHEIRPKNSRPRLSGEGADAALVHLIEREKLRIDKHELP